MSVNQVVAPAAAAEPAAPVAVAAPVPTKRELELLFNKAYNLERSDDLSDFSNDESEEGDANEEPILVRAFLQYTKLVEWGHVESKTRLAVFLFYSWGGAKQDVPRCISLLTETAATGDEIAMRYLEVYKESGGKSLGIPKC